MKKNISIFSQYDGEKITKKLDINTLSSEEKEEILSSDKIRSWIAALPEFTNMSDAFLMRPRLIGIKSKKFLLPESLIKKAKDTALATLEKNPMSRIANKTKSIIEKREDVSYRITEVTLLFGSNIIVIPFDTFRPSTRYLISIGKTAQATLKKGKLYTINHKHQEIIEAHHEDDETVEDGEFIDEHLADIGMSHYEDDIDIDSQPHVSPKIDISKGLIQVYKMPKISFTRWIQWRQRRKAAKNTKK